MYLLFFWCRCDLVVSLFNSRSWFETCYFCIMIMKYRWSRYLWRYLWCFWCWYDQVVSLFIFRSWFETWYFWYKNSEVLGGVVIYWDAYYISDVETIRWWDCSFLARDLKLDTFVSWYRRDNTIWCDSL